MALDPFWLTTCLILVPGVLLASWIDYAQRKVPNWLNVSLIVVGRVSGRVCVCHCSTHVYFAKNVVCFVLHTGEGCYSSCRVAGVRVVPCFRFCFHRPSGWGHLFQPHCV